MTSGQDISHYTTAQLSVHIWNHDLIWWQNKIDTQKHIHKTTITNSWTLSKTKIPITIVKAQMPSNPNQKSHTRDNKCKSRCIGAWMFSEFQVVVNRVAANCHCHQIFRSHRISLQPTYNRHVAVEFVCKMPDSYFNTFRTLHVMFGFDNFQRTFHLISSSFFENILSTFTICGTLFITLFNRCTDSRNVIALYKHTV